MKQLLLSIIIVSYSLTLQAQQELREWQRQITNKIDLLDHNIKGQYLITDTTLVSWQFPPRDQTTDYATYYSADNVQVLDWSGSGIAEKSISVSFKLSVANNQVGYVLKNGFYLLVVDYGNSYLYKLFKLDNYQLTEYEEFKTIHLLDAQN